MSFDPLAPTYDADFTDTQIGRWLRARVHERLSRHFGAGARVLELGCGTGEDALWLAERGVHIFATDASHAMLDIARAKSAHLPNARFERLDLSQLPGAGGAEQVRVLERTQLAMSLPDAMLFDGVFSNFGALNCLEDWRPLAAWLAAHIKPGGVAAFGVMSPFCLWEVGWHSAHGDVKTAFRRLRKGGAAFQPTAHTPALTIHYPTMRRLAHDFSPYFRRVYVDGLGLFLPPSDVYSVIEKRPRLLAALTALESRFARFAPALADHYWIEFHRLDGML